MGKQTVCPHVRDKCLIIRETRLAMLIMLYSNRPQGRGWRDANPQRLAEGFLRGKTLGKESCLIAGSQPFRPLAIRQNTRRERLAVARKRRAYPRNLDDVGADASNHTADSASRIRRFISLTAARSPMNTARLMMACPICNSRTPTSAAMGCTL